MSTLLRIVLLSLFAAGGAGVAVGLATVGLPKIEAAAGLDATSSKDAAPRESSVAQAEPAKIQGEETAAGEFVPRPVLKAGQPPVAHQWARPDAPSAEPDPAEFMRWAGALMQAGNRSQGILPVVPGGAQAHPAAQALEQAVAPGVPNAAPLQPAPLEQAASEHASETIPPPPKTTITGEMGEGDDRLSITIQGEDLRRVLELLSEQGGLNILSSKNVTGTVSASLKNVDIATALDAILKSTGYVWRRENNFIYVGTPEDFNLMRQSSDRVGTRLYRPNYVPAAELQKLITPLLSEGLGTISVTTAAESGIAADSNNAGGNGYAGQEALLVRDYEAVLLQVDQVVQQLDCQPEQVAIEAMVLSVALSDRNEVGVDFEVLRNHVNIATGSPNTSVANVSVDNGGLKVGFLDGSLSAFVAALESVGDTNVIATPRLMCLNKHRAEILIGQQLGYVSTTQTETSTTQSVEFLEVGTQLRIRPFISSDGMIRMEVHPELSTGTVTIEGGFTLPNKEVTQVTTNIMVRDGNTVIIGGLLRDELKTNTTQLPLLGSLPIAGPLFRHKNEQIERREILVLLTPRIVQERKAALEGDYAAAEFHHRHMNYADQMMPVGKRYIGRKYFRRAQEAWAGGNRTEALRLVNLALHFDPLNRAALDLRNDIAVGKLTGDHTLALPGEPHWFGEADPLEGEELPPWLLQQLDEAAQSPRDAPFVPVQP